MDTHVQVSVSTYAYNSLCYIPRHEIDISYGNHMLKILRNCQTASKSDCTILQTNSNA